MRFRFFAIAAAAVLALSACQAGDDGEPGTSPGDGGATGSPGDGTDECLGEGTVIVSGWEASAEEGQLLQQMFDDFMARCPNITIDYQPSADYAPTMVANFAAGTVPDVFYVDSSVAPEWIEEGFLLPLDDYISQSGFDTSAFYEGYLDAFRGPDGAIYGLPKDASTLAMFYNPDLLSEAGVDPPTNWDELTSAAEALTTGDTAGLCLSADLARALAFIYQNGGSIYNEDFTEVTFDSPEVREAIDFYMSFFQNGTAATPGELGVDWCGAALGEQKAAIVFEGNWLIPFMEGTYPDTPFELAEMPAGEEQATLAFTVSYSIGADSQNPDAGWSLLSYLTGPEGMETWTSLGLALPSRSDVAVPEGRDALVAGAEYARPWSFVPRFGDVAGAFNNAMTAAIEGDGGTDEIVQATVDAAEGTTR